MASLIGYGNHGRDVETIWLRADRRLLAIYDDDPGSGMYPPPVDLKGRIVVGVNDPSLRRRIAERYPTLRGIHPLVDPSAIIGIDVHLGKGVVIAPFALLLRSVTLSDHVHVNYMASMTRCHVGAYSSVSPGAVICGNVEIGEECTIGANATVCERSTIGNLVTIGAGAIVPPWSVVPDNTIVTGVWKEVDECSKEQYFSTSALIQDRHLIAS